MIDEGHRRHHHYYQHCLRHQLRRKIKIIILKININTTSCILIESSFDGASSPTKKKNKNSNKSKPLQVVYPSKGLSMVVLFLLKTE